jgi:tetratricopeptide (TPR) repeat protein
VNSSRHKAETAEPETAPVAFRFRNMFLLLSVAAAAILPYLNALPNDFVWDDRALILRDPQVHSVKNLPAIFRRDFFAFSENRVKYGYYRPLITLSYMVDIAVWGHRPWGFRITNLAFHVACSLLVVALARRLRMGAPWTPWLAGWLFALHPTHTESVTWIAGRTDVLATFFLLAAFLLYVRAAEAAVRPRATLALSLSAWLAAALCKETALVFPFFVLLYERLLRGEPWRRAWRQTTPFIAALALYVLWRSGGTNAGWNPAGFLEPLVFAASLLKTLWRYVAALVWPAALSAYIQNPAPRSLGDPYVWAGALLAAGSLWLYFRYRARTRLAWLVPAFFAALLPVMNFIRISAPADMGFPMAERFLYLPSVFFCIGAAGLIEQHVPSSPLRWILALALAGGLGIRIMIRNKDWRDEETFFRVCLQDAPDAPLLYAALATHDLDAGRHEQAIAGFQRARRLNLEQTALDSHFLLNNLAAAYRAAGRHQEALAILNAIPSSFAMAPVYHNRAECLAALGQPQAAEAAYRTALELDRYNLESWVSLGRLLQAQNRPLDAAECYRRAIALFPHEPTLRNALGIALKNAGRIAEAVESFKTAVRMDPNDVHARGNLGVALALLGDMSAAETELRAALALNPRHTDSWNALGTLYARQKRLEDAARCFDAALVSDPHHAEALINKGVLRYQEGRADEASALFRQALNSDPQNARARSYVRQLENRKPSDIP